MTSLKDIRARQSVDPHKNDTAIKRTVHVGRKSLLIDQILSAGSYKNRQGSNTKSGYNMKNF